MIEISKILDDGRKIKRVVKNKNSLDNLLIDSYFVDHVSDENVMKLRQKKATNSEIIIADFLAGNNVDIINKLDYENLGTILSSSYIGVNYSSKKQEKGLSTPIKVMASVAYNSLLKNDASKSLLEKTNSKEDCKAIVFFDYIFDKLHKKRKNIVEEKLENSDELGEVLKTSTLLYIIQSSIPILANANKEIINSINGLNGKEEIETSDVKRYKQLRDDRPPQLNFEIDKEALELMSKRRELFGQYQDLAQEKVYKKIGKLEDKLSSINTEFKELNSRELLNNSDDGRMGDMIDKLNGMNEFYDEAEIDNKPVKTGIKDTRNSIQRLLNEHQFYNEHKELLENYLRAMKINQDNFNLYLEKNKFTKCRELVYLINAQTRELNGMIIRDNRYLKKSSEKNIEELKGFYSEASANANRYKEEKKQEASELERTISSNSGFFYSIFKKPFLKFKLRRLNKKISVLDEIKNYISYRNSAPHY